jgi:large subunit ribosomal protein L4
MYRAALRSMFSELLRQGRLLVAQDLSVTAPKTKELKAKLDALGVERALLVVEAFDQNLWLAARNLPHVLVDDIASVNPASLASAQTVVLTVAAAKILEERLA